MNEKLKAHNEILETTIADLQEQVNNLLLHTTSLSELIKFFNGGLVIMQCLEIDCPVFLIDCWYVCCGNSIYLRRGLLSYNFEPKHSAYYLTPSLSAPRIEFPRTLGFLLGRAGLHKILLSKVG